MHYRILIPLFIIVWLNPSVGSSQQYGQWKWFGHVGADSRTIENETDGVPTTEFETQQLNLGLGLTGFIFDPAVAKFQLGLEFGLVRSGASFIVDQDRIGGFGFIEIFPKGSYPSSLYFSSSSFSYDSNEEEPTGIGLADQATTFGGRFKIRKGPARGTEGGFDRSSTSYLEATQDARFASEYLFWNPPRKKSSLRGRYRLDHTRREFSNYRGAIETLLFSGNEHGKLGQQWLWDFQTTLRGRASEQLGRDTQETLGGTVRNQFSRDVTDKGFVSLSHVFGYVSNGDSDLTSNSLFARYLHRFTPKVSIGPYLGATHQVGEDTTFQSQSAGISALWNGFIGPAECTINGNLGYQGQQQDVELGSETKDTGLVAGLGIGLRHGQIQRLRIGFDLGINLADSKSTITFIDELPDLGTSTAQTGDRQRNTARLTLWRRWGRTNTSFFTQYEDIEIRPLDAAEPSTTQIINLNAQVNRGPLHFTLSSVNVTANSSLARQEVVSKTGALAWRPWNPLDIQISYRIDSRQQRGAPDLETSRIEGHITYQFGLLAIGGNYFEGTETVGGGSTRFNRGIFWFVSRNFQGLLPIVTTPKRRGVIR